MARTLSEIKNAIVTDIGNDSVLKTELTSTSKFAKWNAFAYIVAAQIWVLENVFDIFKADVQTALLAMKPHTALWYRDKALAFEYGKSLVYGTDEYDNIGMTDQDIETAQIVKQVAIIESQGQLTIKSSKLDSGNLAKLSNAELTAFEAYMEKIKDAGNKINYISDDPDYLKLELLIYYDPLIFDSLGQRLDGTNNKPILSAIQNYLLELPFNAELIKTKLTDALQIVEGIKVPVISNAWYKFGANDWDLMNERYIPHSGYFKIYDINADLIINYIPDNVN